MRLPWVSLPLCTFHVHNDLMEKVSAPRNRFFAVFCLIITLALQSLYNGCAKKLSSLQLNCVTYENTYLNRSSSSLSKTTLDQKSENIFKYQKIHLPSNAAHSSYNQLLSNYEGGDFAVILNPSCAKNKGHGFAHEKGNKNGPPGRTREFITYRVNDTSELRTFISDLEADDCVIGAGPNVTYTLSSTFTDPLSLSNQDHLAPIMANEGYEYFYNQTYGVNSSDDSKVVIAIIDSGIAYTHSDLADKVINLQSNGNSFKGYDAFTSNYTNNSDLTGHGTHVAGLIAANANADGIHGLAPLDTYLLNINVLFEGSNGPTTNSAIISEGIQFAIDNNADIINLSLQTIRPPDFEDPVLRQSIVNAVNAGVFISISAGNTNETTVQSSIVDNLISALPGKYGAEIDGAMTVAALNKSTGLLANFSLYDPETVEIAAPGEQVYSTYFNSSTPYNRLSGTSQSAPLVSGAAALAISILKKYNFNPTPALIEELITNSSKVVSSESIFYKNGNQLSIEGLSRLMAQLFPKTVGKACLP